MSRYAAYIDESGNHDLGTDKAGASRYFLVLAVIVDQNDVPSLSTAVEEIRQQFFGPGEVKSSRVSDDRRVKILKALEPLAFRFYAVAVDKSRVDKDSGLAYKASFMKFANGRLYQALFQNLCDVAVYADGHGSSEFIESFRRYIETTHKRDLFSESEISIVDSKAHILVQLADFLVGTAAKIYEEKSNVAFRTIFLEFLRAKRIRIDEWPPRFETQFPVSPSSSELDGKVRSISLRVAARFLTEHSEDPDVEAQIQHAFLSYLLFNAQFHADGDYVPTQEILSHLHVHGFPEVTRQYVRSHIVSKLRDRGVIIVSSPRGYKIPTSYVDVVGFAELVDGLVCPLLQRLKRANDTFDLGTAGEINVLAERRFKKLRSMLNLEAE
jgi:hypothetical protein